MYQLITTGLKIQVPERITKANNVTDLIKKYINIDKFVSCNIKGTQVQKCIGYMVNGYIIYYCIEHYYYWNELNVSPNLFLDLYFILQFNCFSINIKNKKKYQ